MKTTKPKPVKQIYSQTYHKGKNILDIELLKSFIERNLVEGYIIKDGKLSDGNSFAEIHLTINEEKKKKFK